MNSYAAVPQILIDLPQWIVWKHEIRNKKPTKVPYDAKAKSAYAKSNDASTWASFDKALETASDILNDYDGVGFMLQGTDLIGIDFDGVLKDGAAEPYVLEILKHLGNPYCEVTPSGNGLRAFVQCAALPAGQRKFSGNHYGAEIYSGGEGGRYLTVTGAQFSGDGVPKLAEIDLAYFMVSQIRNDKLKKLWMGDISEYGDDHSRADLGLLDLLALLFNRDPEKVEWAFGASALGQREKWTEREDYRKRTIAKALTSNAAVSALVAPQRRDQNAATFSPAEAILRTGDTIKPKKIHWLWDEHIPLGKITLYAGNPDNGKSLAAMDLAARVTRASAFPNGAKNTLIESDVLMLLGEDDIDDTAVPRLMAAHADLSKIHFLESVRRPNSGDSEVRLDWDLPAIESKLESHPNIKLIIIDPISNYLGDVSMVAEQEARSILIPLKRIAARLGIAVVIVMHLNKKSELEAISRVGGAMAFIGVARCSWMFTRDAATDDGEIKDSFSMVRIKNNLTRATGSGIAYRVDATKIPIEGETEPVWAPFVVWGDVVNQTADEVMAKRGRKSHTEGGVAPKLQDAIRWLEGALQGGAVASKKLIRDAKEERNISSDTLRRAQQEMRVVAFQRAGTWLWEMPPMNATTETVATEDPQAEQEGYDHIERGFNLR